MYTLGTHTLPRPKPGNFKRTQIESGASFNTLDGTTKRDIINRKEQFVLSYQMLTRDEVADILSEYNDQTTKNFTVDETNLSIPATEVRVVLSNRQYLTAGNEYRENLVLILTEVK